MANIQRDLTTTSLYSVFPLANVDSQLLVAKEDRAVYLVFPSSKNGRMVEFRLGVLPQKALLILQDMSLRSLREEMTRD